MRSLAVVGADGAGRRRVGQREEFAVLYFDAFPGRVADNARKTAGSVFGEDLWKPVMPTKCVGIDGRIGDQAVAVDDVLGQIGQGLAPAGRANPKRKLCDLDRLMREVDPVQVPAEDPVGDCVLVLYHVGVRHSGAGEAVNDRLVVGIERLVGPDQECTRSARGIANRDGQQVVEARLPVLRRFETSWPLPNSGSTWCPWAIVVKRSLTNASTVRSTIKPVNAGGV